MLVIDVLEEPRNEATHRAELRPIVLLIGVLQNGQQSVEVSSHGLMRIIVRSFVVPRRQIEDESAVLDDPIVIDSEIFERICRSSGRLRPPLVDVVAQIRAVGQVTVEKMLHCPQIGVGLGTASDITGEHVHHIEGDGQLGTSHDQLVVQRTRSRSVADWNQTVDTCSGRGEIGSGRNVRVVESHAFDLVGEQTDQLDDRTDVAVSRIFRPLNRGHVIQPA